MSNLHSELSEILKQISAAPAPGAILRVEAGDDLFFEATGLYEKERTRLLDPADGFRIASMSKTFTGTLVMQLVEAGVLALDAPLGEFIDVSDMPIQAGHDKTEITIERLLQHRSGLNDFAMSADWAKRVWQKSKYFFDPKDTLAWAFENGAAVHAPGEKFEYSDTNYVALGLVIERVAGLSWGDLCRRNVLEPCGMKSTWLEGYESPRSSLSHTYFDDSDGLAIHGSVDWAAGGHVSTCEDLSRFLRTLMAGELFSHEDTIARMIDGGDNGMGGTYGAGIMQRHNGDRAMLGHSGFWGSFMLFVPDVDATITGTVNHTGASETIWSIDRIVGLL